VPFSASGTLGAIAIVPGGDQAAGGLGTVGAVAGGGLGFLAAAALLLLLLFKKKKKGEDLPMDEGDSVELTTTMDEPAQFISEYGFSDGPQSMASDDESEPADLPRGEMTGDGSNGDEMSETNPNEWNFGHDVDEAR
jgi:hypothetical protein